MKTFKYIRIISYIMIIISMIILKYTNLISWKCYIKEQYGVLCPSCGITTAMKSILNLDFQAALKNNAYCTLILFPIFVILFIDDIICMIKHKKSFVDIIFGE